jgi:YHS domain-containing protein
MTWIIRIALILLLILLVVRAGWRLLEGVVQGAVGTGGRRGGRVPQAGTKMVKDPVCGTYVVQSKALSASSGGETAWFCSSKCQQAWQRR